MPTPTESQDVTQLPQARTFEYRSVIASTVEQITAFHNQPGTLRRLTPPPIIMQKLFDERTSLTEGDVKFRLWFGPVPVYWHARHEPGPASHAFADRMIEGPMAYWRHEHIFYPVSDGVELIDRVTLVHKPGIRGLLTRIVFGGLLLRFLFFYRHRITRFALRRNQQRSGR